MAKWKTFQRPPNEGDRVIVVFYWPDGEAYNMTILAWSGWNAYAMEMDGWGEGTYPVVWTSAPEYPNNLPDIG